MLRDLVVEGLGVIEGADVTLETGTTALTGETGAGKTLVVAALGLLLGGRADRSLLRTGAEQARVDGRFALPATHPTVATLHALGLLDDASADDDEAEVEVIVSRTVTPTASKARINGRIVTVAVLQEAVGGLIEIAGQNEHQRLGSASFQRRFLDAFAGEEAVALAATVAEQVGLASEARDRAEELRASERTRSRELDVLRYEIAEISSAGVTPGESARLAAEASRLEAAEEIAVALDRAIDSLRGEGGAEDSLGVATDEARKLADRDPELEPLALRLDSARLEIADVAAELSRRIVQPDPQALADTRERLDVISRMRRKYGDTEEEVLAYLERSERRVEELSSEDTDAALWEERSEAAIAAATAASLRLGELRRGAAAALRVQVEGSLAELAMPDAVFEVVLEERELYEGGMETIRFDVTANKGEAPKPLAKVASGGELSRIALALHLADPSATATTTVFDEVDAGVGGGAAQAVGRSLAEVARNSGGQVIVVTHLPQVAAFADNHLRVTKVSEGGRTRAEVERVADDARVQELSRMLAGMPDSEVGREHARELLALAGGGAPGA